MGAWILKELEVVGLITITAAFGQNLVSVDSTEHERVLIFIFSLNFALFLGDLQKLLALQIIERHVNGHLNGHYTVVAHDREVAKCFEGADGAFGGGVLH